MTTGGAGVRAPRDPSDQRGSQAVELALLLPAVAMVATLVLLCGLAGADLVAAHVIARDAARHAAVDDTDAAHAAAADAAGDRDHELSLQSASGGITARVRLQPRALAAVAPQARLPAAEATMRVEEPP